MTDTFVAIADVADSPSMRRRVTACAAQESIADPEQWAYANRWGYAAAPGWGAAFASAQAGGNPDPGADPAVVTDDMIRAQVQAMLGAAGT